MLGLAILAIFAVTLPHTGLLAHLNVIEATTGQSRALPRSGYRAEGPHFGR